MKKNIPYICGGILFDLLLEARKTRTQARTTVFGDTDSLSDTEIFKAFSYIVSGNDEYLNLPGTTIKRCVSDYKKGVLSNGAYILFFEKHTIDCFRMFLENDIYVIWNRVYSFIQEKIGEVKREWLVKALFETIQSDCSIDDLQEFQVQEGVCVTKNDLNSVEECNIVVFLASVIGFVMLNRPGCKEGRDTFLAWYFQENPRCQWKFRAEIGSKMQSVRIDFSMPTKESREDNTDETDKGSQSEDSSESHDREESFVFEDDENSEDSYKEFYRDPDISVRMLEEMKKGHLSSEAQKFCFDYEEQMNLLPICQIAIIVYPLHTFVGTIYNDYAKLSSAARSSLLHIFQIDEIEEKESWVYTCIDKYKKEIIARGLTERDYLYDSAKYFRRTIQRYSHMRVKEYNPKVFKPIMQGNKQFSPKDNIDIAEYIGEYIRYKKKSPNLQLMPPFDFLWQNRNLGECSEVDVTYWVSVFIIESIVHMNFQDWMNGKYSDYSQECVTVDTSQIRTMEDLFLFALYYLHDRYC